MEKSATTTDEKVLVEKNGLIKTITFNQPKKKNAITPEMTHTLLKELGNARIDGTRVVILTGAEGNFSSGADISSSVKGNPKEYDVTNYLRKGMHAVVTELRQSDFISIAKVRGYAAGVGGNFALACDMTFASEEAIFSQIFTNIGLSSDGGGAYFMLKALGYSKALELMITSAKVPATEAAKMGLINHSLPENELDAKVQEMANFISEGPFLAIKNTKANLREAANGNLLSTLEMEAKNQGFNFKSDDFIEGVMAFMQKRKANWKGK